MALVLFLQSKQRNYWIKILKTVDVLLNKYKYKYGNVLLMEDFNSSVDDSLIKTFCKIYESRFLLTEPTCLKNPQSPSCINLIETGLSDFHKIVTKVIKILIPKAKPSILSYRSYKMFENVRFVGHLRFAVYAQSNKHKMILK